MSGSISTPKSSSSLGSKVRLLLGLLISVACIVWVLSSVESKELMEKLKGVSVGYLSLAVLTTFLSYFLRAYRWPMFFGNRPPSFWVSYRCLILGFFMNNVLPARIGELVRAHLGGKASRHSRSLVLATIAGERLADGLAISLLFAVLFSVFSDAKSVEEGSALFYVSYLFAAAGVGVVALLVCRNVVFGFFEWIASKAPWSAVRFVLLRARKFIEGLEPMLRPLTFVKLSILSACVWFVELGVYFFVSKAFHYPLGIGSLSLFLAAVNFSSLIPSGPGAIGVIEAFATAALVKIGVDRESALAMVGVQHLIQILVVGLPGAYFFVYQMRGKIGIEDDSELISDEEEEALQRQAILNEAIPNRVEGRG